MAAFNRRDFLRSGGALAVCGLIGKADRSLASDLAGDPDLAPIQDTAVRFKGDGLSLTPPAYAHLLASIAGSDSFAADVYATGGIIAELEKEFARLLGKETAVFLPTGTMANHIALRRLAGSRKRVIVQAGSHIYNDSGDCAQELSGLNLLPIEDDFSEDSLNDALKRTGAGRVKTGVGAVSLESPLRRGFNTTYPPDRIESMAALVRDQEIGLHLDGARLFMQAAHQGTTPADLAAPFDTVYVSLYKNFNAAGGAVLAGPKELLADLLHERRMFGGSPAFAWPLAAVALLYAGNFTEEYRKARIVTDQMVEFLKTDTRFEFKMIPGGSNCFWLRLNGGEPESFVANLSDRDIHLMKPRPQWEDLLLMINPTISRMTAENLASAFAAAFTA